MVVLFEMPWIKLRDLSRLQSQIKFGDRFDLHVAVPAQTCLKPYDNLLYNGAMEQSAGEFAVFVTLKILGVLISLYLFLFGLDLMGVSFSALGSKGAGNLFTFSDNPITALMVGILATVLVQSSSTSTSIVIGLVGADVLSVRGAIPIIMGANIGTSVTNTIVTRQRFSFPHIWFGGLVLVLHSHLLLLLLPSSSFFFRFLSLS